MSNQQKQQQGSSRNRGGRSRRQGQGGRNRNRRGGPPKPKAPPKPTAGQRFLQVITFGLAGKPPENQNTGRPKQSPRRGSAEVAEAQKQQAAEATGCKSGGSKRKPRKRMPEIVEVTTPRLYVGNLSFDADEDDLRELFSGAGTVQLAEIVTNRRTQRSKGYGFVEMVTIDEAKRAVETLHDQEFMGRPLVVSGAKSAGPKGSADSAEA